MRVQAGSLEVSFKLTRTIHFESFSRAVLRSRLNKPELFIFKNFAPHNTALTVRVQAGSLEVRFKLTRNIHFENFAPHDTAQKVRAQAGSLEVRFKLTRTIHF